MKANLIIIPSVIFLLIAVGMLYPEEMDKFSALIMIVFSLLFVLYFIYLYESRTSGTKEIAVVALIGAFSAAARIPFAPLPSVQPCTFIILVSGYVLGETAGFMIGAETAFLSNFFLGQGPWTPWQMLGWGLAGVIGSLFQRCCAGRKYELYLFVVLGIAVGYLFGLIMNTWYWLAYTYPHTLPGLILTETMAFPFDTLHAASNAIFIQLFAPKFIKILKKYKDRYGIFKPSCGTPPPR